MSKPSARVGILTVRCSLIGKAIYHDALCMHAHVAAETTLAHISALFAVCVPAEGAHPLHLLTPTSIAVLLALFAACCLPRRLRLHSGRTCRCNRSEACRRLVILWQQRSSSSHSQQKQPQQQSRRQLWRQRYSARVNAPRGAATAATGVSTRAAVTTR
jgi:hypothetical protein